MHWSVCMVSASPKSAFNAQQVWHTVYRLGSATGPWSFLKQEADENETCLWVTQNYYPTDSCREIQFHIYMKKRTVGAVMFWVIYVFFKASHDCLFKASSTTCKWCGQVQPTRGSKSAIGGVAHVDQFVALGFLGFRNERLVLLCCLEPRPHTPAPTRIRYIKYDI